MSNSPKKVIAKIFSDIADGIETGSFGQRPQQHQEPAGDMQQAQTDHSKAHDRTGGESHPQSAVKPLRAGMRRTAVGRCGDLHTHEATEGGEKAAADKSERNHPSHQAKGSHNA